MEGIGAVLGSDCLGLPEHRTEITSWSLMTDLGRGMYYLLEFTLNIEKWWD